MAIEVYKILNKKSPMYLNDLFVYKESRYSFNRKTNTGLTTKMPNNWTIIKITHYKRKIYS
jgi:hypothetical protein